MILSFCVACGDDDTSKLEQHHLVPRSVGGSDDPKNLITLCHTCHGLAHGFKRRNIRRLTADGIAAAKARGSKPGNPGLRARDPEAIQKIATARDAFYLNQLKASSKTWLPIVQEMRPSHSWEETVDILNKTVPNARWSIPRLCRAVKRLVEEGLADQSLLRKAPRRPPADTALPIILSIRERRPEISFREIGAELESLNVPTPRGGKKWNASSVAHLMRKAQF
jgi:hypothetical protein